MDLFIFLEESLADGVISVTFNGLDCEWVNNQWMFSPRNFSYILDD